jgi:hypothetical protein
MMNGQRVFLCRVFPRFEHLEDEEAILDYKLAIDDLAFKIRITLVDERCFHV